MTRRVRVVLAAPAIVAVWVAAVACAVIAAEIDRHRRVNEMLRRLPLEDQ